MTVIGIIIIPADARAIAPVVRFAKFDSWGSADEDFWDPACEIATNPVEARKSECAQRCLRALSVEKYSAEPTPVRMTDGSVPRQSCLRVFGLVLISRKVGTSEVEPDC